MKYQDAIIAITQQLAGPIPREIVENSQLMQFLAYAVGAVAVASCHDSKVRSQVTTNFEDLVHFMEVSPIR